MLFMPKLFSVLKQGYSLGQLKNDTIAGVIVGIVALPLAIAFAIASGVTPDKGLITAVIAGLLISALGGSRVQIGGPTGAFVVIVYGIIEKHGIEGLILATLMAGFILILFGLVRFGSVIKFIPRPVTIGFTSGIAVVIFTSQIKDFLGLSIEKLPPGFFEKWHIYLTHINSANGYAVLIAIFTIVMIIVWQRFIKKVPGAIFAMIAATAIVHIFKLPLATIGNTFGEIPHKLPMPTVPHFNLEMAQELIMPALVIAILAGIESLLSAVVADGMIGGKHRSNTELIAQGIANIATAMFGGIPATGAIARTAVNVQNGGRSPIAGIVHAVTLLAIMLLFAPLAKLIPLASLAGILIIVSYHMAQWHSFGAILKAPKSDIMVLLATFLLTVIVDLTVAIQVGMVLAAFLLIYRLSQTQTIRQISKNMDDEEEPIDPYSITSRDIPEGVEVFEVQGAFFFGVISSFLETVQNIEKQPKVRIIRMRHALSIDETAINALRYTHHFCQKNEIKLVLSGVHAQPLFALEKCGFVNEIGLENICGNIDGALNCARKHLDLPAVELSHPELIRNASNNDKVNGDD